MFSLDPVHLSATDEAQHLSYGLWKFEGEEEKK
jgi:hypothetical protein